MPGTTTHTMHDGTSLPAAAHDAGRFPTRAASRLGGPRRGMVGSVALGLAVVAAVMVGLTSAVGGDAISRCHDLYGTAIFSTPGHEWPPSLAIYCVATVVGSLLALVSVVVAVVTILRRGGLAAILALILGIGSVGLAGLHILMTWI